MASLKINYPQPLSMLSKHQDQNRLKLREYVVAVSRSPLYDSEKQLANRVLNCRCTLRQGHESERKVAPMGAVTLGTYES